MSAVNIAILSDRAVVYTDAAHYDANGLLVKISDKAVETETKLVVTGRGQSLFTHLIAGMIDRCSWSIDEVEADAGSMMENGLEALARRLDLDPDEMPNDIFIVGWSASRGRPLIAQWSNCAPANCNRFSMVDSVVAPDMSVATMQRIKTAMGPMRRETVDLDRLCLETMKAQRFEAGTAKFGCEGQFLIGGHIQRAEVTANGVRKTIVHRWPEDQVGERIRPIPALDPVAHPNAVPMPAMNRAERRRLAKSHRG